MAQTLQATCHELIEQIFVFCNDKKCLRMVILIEIWLHKALDAQLLRQITHLARFYFGKHVVFIIPIDCDQLRTDNIHCLAVQI